MDSEFAILTPVPLEHLESGATTCEREGRVAYGSDSGLVLSEAAEIARSSAFSVLFYASHTADAFPPKVSWCGEFVGLREPKQGRHPEHDRFRPFSTDTDGGWMIFFEVSKLRRLGAETTLPIGSLKRRNGVKLAKNFIPLGPIIIENPF